MQKIRFTENTSRKFSAIMDIKTERYPLKLMMKRKSVESIII